MLEYFIFFIIFLTAIGVPALVHYLAGRYLRGLFLSTIALVGLVCVLDFIIEENPDSRMFPPKTQSDEFFFFLYVVTALIISAVVGLIFLLFRISDRYQRLDKCPGCKSEIPYDIRSNSVTCRNCGFSPKNK